jgi:hypothetical protein
MNFGNGDFVSYKGESWLITTIDENDNLCDLINQYKEEKWNVDVNSIKLIAKFNALK